MPPPQAADGWDLSAPLANRHLLRTRCQRRSDRVRQPDLIRLVDGTVRIPDLATKFVQLELRAMPHDVTVTAQRYRRPLSLSLRSTSVEA